MEHANPFPTSAAGAQRARRFLRASRWLALLLGIMLLQLGGVLALNYVVDPRAEFSSDAFEPIVVNARELKTHTYVTMDPRPETIVFGSSRAMTIMPDVLEEGGYGPGYNFAVNSGKVIDALAIYRITVAAGSAPRDLVLLTEDWSFRSPRQTDWPEADLGARGAIAFGHRLLETADSDYVRDSVRSVELHVRGFPLRDTVFLDDGSAIWEKTDHAVASGTFNRSAGLEHLRGYAKEFYDEGFIAPEKDYVDAFHALLDAARSNGTRILFVMPPMTEEARGYVDAAIYSQALDATRALLLDACGPGVRVMDFSRAEWYGATDEDFTDGYHPTREGGEKLTRAIVAGDDLCQQEI